MDVRLLQSNAQKKSNIQSTAVDMVMNDTQCVNITFLYLKRRLHGKAYYKLYVSLHITTILDVTSATQLPQYIRLFMYSQIYNQSIKFGRKTHLKAETLTLIDQYLL